MPDSPTGPLSDSVLGEGHTTPTRASSSDASRPTQVGPYRILDLLGEGGMGEVYRAERREPIHQVVAIKVVKLGLDSREVIARFESERQTLALMDHPAIAKVIDAGTTDAGRPYFVMEYVAGQPITTFCDEQRLSIEQRLQLFTQVCEAIAHAHTKTVIHRDIKPSNVLAYLQDGRPAVKVIDFGIAKALTGERGTDLTLDTGIGRAIGTYDCMSPEQADGSADIDTRSDVYSLGVLLYELLTGAKPFDHVTLVKAADAEIRRIIREVDPPRPSTKLSDLGALAPALAERRQARLDALASQLRSELEWIPLKAMRKERDRRYASADQLADDVRNYLAGRALLAGPETTSYRVRKFAKRNRTAIALAAVAAVAVIGATAFYVQSIRQEQARTQAALDESKKQQAEAERQRAKAESQRAEAQRQAAVARDSSNFLANILRNADPEKSFGENVTVVQALDRAVASLDGKGEKIEPLSEAMVRYIVGTTYRTLGRLKEALPQLERARELDAANRAPDDTQTSVTLSDLAWVYLNLGNTADAEKYYLQSLALDEKANPVDPLSIATSLLNLAQVYKNQQRFAEAEPLQLRALAMRRERLKEDDPLVLSALNNLAQFYWMTNQLEKAEPIARETLATRKRIHPPGHAEIARSTLNLSVLLRDQQKYADAEPLAREAVAMRRKLFPAQSPDLAVAVENLGRILYAMKQLDESETLLTEVLTIRQAALPEGDMRTVDTRFRLALITRDRGKLDEAEKAFREVLAAQTKKDPKAAPTRTTARTLAALLEQTKRPAEAGELLKTYGIASTTQPTTGPSRY
jgi:serine/threonine protein kinase